MKYSSFAMAAAFAGSALLSSSNALATTLVTPPATTPYDQKSDATDANDQLLDGGRLGISPDELPGSNPPSNEGQIADLQRELTRVTGEIISAINLLADLEGSDAVGIIDTDSLINLVQVFVPIDFVAPGEINSERRIKEVRAQINELIQRQADLKNRIRELGGDPNAAPAPDDFIPSNPGDLSDIDLQDLGDGEEILYFPRMPQNSALNNISAYNAITASASRIKTQFINQSDLGNIWSRSKVTYLDGTIGRTGYAGNVQLGFAKTLMPGLDVGGFVSGFVGRVSSSVLNSDTTSAGLGVGTYLKYALTDELEAGISVFYERSNNSITIGPDSGTYKRDLLQISASLAGNYQVGVINVAPRAALNWTYSDRNAYTDSAAITVPGSINSQLTATAGVTLSRTILLTEGKLHSITPSVGANLNYNITNLDVLNLAGGNTIVESTFNAEIFAGARFEFIEGATTDIRFGVQGLGGSTQSYSASLGINVPIH
ncbi:MAG: autotransporter outer membrane beta-barrel domain-containing protein [Devosiaceae bacterium]|nr:autotransporter outer membrane beta-barrel domain-containing protein [Devosiaceae bacterium]